MFKNYLKTAIRNLAKFKAYTVINLLGLAIGMACFLLIMRYIQQELSYDKLHANSERIYRVDVEIAGPQGKAYSACTPYPECVSAKSRCENGDRFI